jgi:hypothetical protein
MPYSASFQDEGFVQVSVSSPCTKEDHYTVLEQALALCEEHQCSLLLVDLRDLDTAGYSTFACFSFGETLANRSRHLKIAHVLPSDAASKRDVQFTSNVEANRGKTTGDFETVAEAKAWLLHSEVPHPTVPSSAHE